MRVCFYTLGCKVNLNETGALEQLFRANGFTIAQEGEAADVFIGCAAKSAKTPVR